MNILIFGDGNARQEMCPHNVNAYVVSLPAIYARTADFMLQHAIAEYKPDAVVLVLGTNDRASGDEWYYTNQTLQDLRQYHKNTYIIGPFNTLGILRNLINNVHFHDEEYQPIRQEISNWVESRIGASHDQGTLRELQSNSLREENA